MSLWLKFTLKISRKLWLKEGNHLDWARLYEYYGKVARKDWEKKLIGNKTFRAQIYVGDHEELVTEIERLFSHKKFAINIVPEYSRSVDQRKLLLNCFFLWRLAYLQGSWVRLQTPLPITWPPKKNEKGNPKAYIKYWHSINFWACNKNQQWYQLITPQTSLRGPKSFIGRGNVKGHNIFTVNLKTTLDP